MKNIYNNDEDIDILEETDVKEEVDSDSGKKLILHNDDITPFDSVINALVQICKIEYEIAVQLTYIVHYQGKCIVQEGAEDKLKKMKMAFEQRGIIATVED